MSERKPASMPVTDDHLLRRQLIEAYEALTPLEQAVLQLLSVVYDGAAKNSLLNCVRRCALPAFCLLYTSRCV